MKRNGKVAWKTLIPKWTKLLVLSCFIGIFTRFGTVIIILCFNNKTKVEKKKLAFEVKEDNFNGKPTQS